MGTLDLEKGAAKIIINKNELNQKISTWKNSVDLESLDRSDKLIHDAHVKAIDNDEDTYIDPESGYSVLTMSFHLKKGKCCGNGCRHCPYNHENVPADKIDSSGVYNTAFYKK